ncbi:MAG TPA: response regulator [Patescibacteria group bacterium]|nr:response regulator [Patescibacteria group bacterium]
MDSSDGTNDLKAHILLVEDNETDAFAIKSILEEDYTIYMARDSAEAIRQLYLAPINVIMLDINLGDKSLSGFQLIDYLKMQGRFDNVKVIAITGRSLESMQQNASFTKFDAYLYKPISKPKIIEAIEAALLLRPGHVDLSDNAAEGKDKKKAEE